MYGEKIRGGNRGGHDRFNWDDVKNDKFRDLHGRERENYLGHSLHGQIGRWTTTARGSDLTWWSEGRSQLNRTQAEELQQKEERRLVKEAEEDAMREAMGLEPINRSKTIKLDKHELKALFERNATERDEAQAAERVEGMGYKPAWDHSIKPGGGSAADETMEGTGVGSDAEDDRPEQAAAAAPSHEAALDRVLAARQNGSDSDDGRSRRRTEKKHKKEKKHRKEKKHKKEKKHRKEKKHKRRRHDSTSDSDSGGGYKKVKLNARGGLKASDGAVALDARALGL